MLLSNGGSKPVSYPNKDHILHSSSPHPQFLMNCFPTNLLACNHAPLPHVNLCVTDVCANSDFIHMSRFSAEYNTSMMIMMLMMMTINIM